MKKPRCLAFLPRKKHKDGGRCCLDRGHDGDHRTDGVAEWVTFSDELAEYHHPNTDGAKDRVLQLEEELRIVSGALTACGFAADGELASHDNAIVRKVAKLRQRFEAMELAANSLADAVSDNVDSLLSAEADDDLMAWVISRWDAEVKNRPTKNIYRRVLDETWRQVYRKVSGGEELPR